MGIRLSELAARLGAAPPASGFEDFEVTGMNTLEAAGPTEVSFLANPKYVRLLPGTKAGAVLMTREYAGDVAVPLVSENPYLAFAMALTLFAKTEGEFSGVSDQAFVHESARVAPSARIAPFAYVGARAVIGENARLFPHAYVGEDCSVGEATVIGPNVSLMSGTSVGARCLLHAGVVLGSDGFGFVPAPDGGGIQKIPQTGTVSVGDDVEIGANTTVDRAVVGATRIGSGTKIDNLVQVGHNVVIGENCLIVAQVGIAGSASTGDGVTIAGQTGISGHLHIGDGATIGPRTGLNKDVAPGARLAGVPAMPEGDFLRSLAAMRKLPELIRKMNRMQKQLDALGRDAKGETDV